jgi:tetratricopeptide (TPR) repeat protein
MPKGKGRRSDFAYSRNAGDSMSFKPLPRRMQEGLEQADELAQGGDPIAAREMLQDLDRQYPNRPEILTDLVNLNIELHDIPSLTTTCERLIKVAPRIPEPHITLGGAYMDSMYLVLALRQYQHFLKHFPGHERANDVRAAVADLEKIVAESSQKWGFIGPDGLAFLQKHEQAQVYLAQGNYEQGRRLCEEMIRVRPNFVAAYNNLSLLHYISGHYEQAIAAANKTLSIEPDNIHALSNLTRFYCICGYAQEARNTADRLRDLQDPNSADLPIKKAEAFSFVGENQAVLDVALAAEKEFPNHERELPSNAFLWHLGGTAAMRLGDEKTARRLWQRALTLSPGFALTRENLDALALPIGERHTAWPFSLSHWLRRPALEALADETKSATKRTKHISEDEGDRPMTKAIQRALHKFPELQTLVPILLERGDPQGRELALMIATVSKAPVLLKALTDFALSQFGPDALRMKAAQAAREANLLPPGPTRMWQNGQWQDLIVMSFHITREPAKSHHAPHVQDLLERAYDALYDDDADTAEPLLKEALALEPNSPNLMNNLAEAYELQGRADEAHALLLETHQRFPDYFFTRAAIAIIHAKKGEVDEAKTLLEPLLTQSKYHISEFAALCMAEVELDLAMGQPEAAKHWVNMLAQIEPDHPVVQQLQNRLAPPPSTFSKLLRKATGGIWKR